MLLLSAALAICQPGPRSHCIVDGDTLWLEGEKIRLLDIDTPEMQGRCEYENRLARQARARLVQLMNAGPYRIERDGTDRYGRTLARVSVNGRDVGQVLVREGLARPYGTGRRSWC